MFKQILKKHDPDNLSKADFYKKWELFELFENLHEAERLLTDIGKDENEVDFLEFKGNFIEELYDIEGDNVADFTQIWKWFTPAKEWDTLVGQNGELLGNNIFRITNNWKRNQEFLNAKTTTKPEGGLM